MTSLLVYKDKIKEFYGQNSIYIRPFTKFLLAFFSMMFLHMATGYMDLLGSPAIMLILALLCAFLPNNLMIVTLIIYIVAEMYGASMEAAIVLLVCLMIMYLLYYKFAPKDSLILILMPVFFVLKMPYLIPILVGLLLTPFSVVSVAFGTFLYYAINFISTSGAAFAKTGEDAVAGNLSQFIAGIIGNKMMYASIVVFALTIVVVYAVKRLSMDNASMYAIGAGCLVQMVGFVLVRMTVDETVAILVVILMTVVSGIIAALLDFLILPLDYSRTEVVQYEDDDYYYYVKAVPKYTVTKPEIRVKRINARKERTHRHPESDTKRRTR
ncbi:MAG: hypothetical protein E7269_03010 [Lachnospiraceae bacterium]|nr:hypothetical protein [Lachnospiraceae bacterium]